jgi:putative FmdB family regulatory protein
MPIYEYECRQCKKTFTEKQTFEEHDQHKKVKCPKCRSASVQQVISPTFAKTSKKS